MKKILAVGSGISATLFNASVAFAQGDVIDVNPNEAGFRIQDLSRLINSLLRLTLGIVGLLVFIYLIWGGIEWITAGGDKSKTESARQKITNAIIGLAIVAAAFAISVVLSNFFGISVGDRIEIQRPY